VECLLRTVWPLLGYASLRQGVICELVNGRSYEERCCFEDDPSLYYVTYLESVIIDVSRTRRGLERSSSISFFLLFILGLQAGLHCESLAL
jgi:hypothetical protein